MKENEVSIEVIHERVKLLQLQFLQELGMDEFPSGFKLINVDAERRGHFLSFDLSTVDRAGFACKRLRERYGVLSDSRGARLRLGFAIYHDPIDVSRLAEAVRGLIDDLSM